MKFLKTFSTGFVISFSALIFISPAHAGSTANDPGTLAHHLATNAAGHASGFTGGYGDELEFRAPFATNELQLARLTNAAWTQAFWLKNVTGLGATPIGYREVISGQGLPTLVSPRHYLCASHMHPEGYTLAFLDTHNAVHWRKTLQRTDVGGDTSLGILDQDLPPSVGFLPVLPENFTNYLPTANTSIVQGIGMNQDFCLFSEPMNFANRSFVTWNSALNVPDGLGTNWNVTLRGGDSSNPAMLLVGTQLVLVSHNSAVGGGPNYAFQKSAINEKMHLLSTNNRVASDYQLTEFCLTNWPAGR